MCKFAIRGGNFKNFEMSYFLPLAITDSMKTGGGTAFRITLLGLIQATPFVVANHMRPSVVCTAEGEEREPLRSAVNPSSTPKVSISTLPEPSSRSCASGM